MTRAIRLILTAAMLQLATASNAQQMSQHYGGQYGDNTPPPNFWQFDRDPSDNVPYPDAMRNAATAVGQALGIAEQAARAAAQLPPGNYTIQSPGSRQSQISMQPYYPQRSQQGGSQDVIINGRRYTPAP